MTSFLLVISFIIDGILLYGLFILNTRIKKTEELEMRQKEVATDIEGMFSSYLMEIKEENERLSHLLNKKETAADQNVTETAPEVARRNPEAENKKEENMYEPPAPKEQGASYEPSLLSQILTLKNEGLSIEQMAKELDRGKTEIELLLKFNQKNNRKT